MAGGPANAHAGSGDSARLVPALVLSCAVSVALGLGLVLSSIERTELGYTVRRLESEVRQRLGLATDLEVERGRLLSPYVLERQAEKLGMRAALPGQIRRMETPSATEKRR